MPKKLPSSSEAPWITLLAYHQRNLDLATICWKYWGVTEALASLRQHSLHIWSAGQPAQILSPGYCPAGLGTGSSTSADSNECTAFHSTAHPDNSMGAEVFQLVHWVEHLRAKKSSQWSYSSSKEVFVSKMTHCGESEGRVFSILGHPSIRRAVLFQGMFGSVWKIREYSREVINHWLSMTTPAMNSLQLLLCCLFWSCFTNASHTHIQVINLHIRTWEGDGTSLWSLCWLRSLLRWWPTYSQLPFLRNLSAEWRLNPPLCSPKTPQNDLPLTIYIMHLCPEGIQPVCAVPSFLQRHNSQ